MEYLDWSPEPPESFEFLYTAALTEEFTPEAGSETYCWDPYGTSEVPYGTSEVGKPEIQTKVLSKFAEQE